MMSVTWTEPTKAAAGPQCCLTADFLEREIARVGASLPELRTALAFVERDVGFDPRGYDELSPRMRRLVDLVAVAGQGLAQKLCDSPNAISAI